MSDPSRDTPPRWASWLVLSGATPFVALLGLMQVVHRDQAQTLFLTMLVYASVLLGFIGGVRFGAEIVRKPSDPAPGRLIWAAAQSIIGTAAAGAAVLATHVSVGLLLVGGAAHLAWDIAAARRGLLPGWLIRPRTVAALTSWACIVSGAALLFRDRVTSP